jgi:hypothetical protein
VSTLPWLNSSLANSSCACSLSCSTGTRPHPLCASLVRISRLRTPFRMAAFLSRFRPSAFCLAHTAILELPRSTILVAGKENCGDNREVIRNNRSRRFFFCTHECSPSISATARVRFLDPHSGWRGRKVRFIVGRERILKCKIDPSIGSKFSNRRVCGVGYSAAPGIILRCPTSCTVFGRWS